eukprot:m.290697 g.290697  ORF g.290697 m.290697 type:complete len:119 (+) comp19470_c4_seq1:1873-2229(+)
MLSQIMVCHRLLVVEEEVWCGAGVCGGGGGTGGGKVIAGNGGSAVGVVDAAVSNDDVAWFSTLLLTLQLAAVSCVVVSRDPIFRVELRVHQHCSTSGVSAHGWYELALLHGMGHQPAG